LIKRARTQPRPEQRDLPHSAALATGHVVAEPEALQLKEGGAPGEYSLRLSGPCTAPVSVKLVPPAGDLLEVKPLELTFSPSDSLRDPPRSACACRLWMMPCSTLRRTAR
jgi:hypothetical protein